MLTFVSARAHADPEPETIVIVDQAPAEAARDRDRALGDAPFVTVLHPDEHSPAASVADALATSAGAQTRSLGGLGAYQAVSVRGAAAGQTAVLIDGVPLARIAAVTTDLGRFSLDAFGAVELYRGAVPVELGGAGVGGAVNLVTRLGPGEHGERIAASLGMGSFGARHLRLHYGDRHGALLSSTTLGYQAAHGDYSYFSDNGTLLNPRDDGYLTRRNNGFDQLDGAARIGRSDRRAVAGLRVAAKSQGLPGSTTQPALASSLSTVDVVGDGQLDVGVGRAIARELAYVLVERQRLHDPMGELGLGPAQRAYLTLSAGASSTWHLPLGAHRAVAGIEARGDRFRDRDMREEQPSQTGTRVGGALLGAVDLALTPELVITPAIRLDAMRSAPTAMTAGPQALEPVDPRWDVVPSPRFTLRWSADPDVSIKGSAGWYARLPTLLEVFGNRGYIVGSPGLKPERGPSWDFGGVWAPARGAGVLDRVFLEADLFANRSHDTIAFITTAGYVARAANLGDAQSYGAELVASARIARLVSLTASYTRLVTEQHSADPSVDGKPLPRSPGHLLYARADASTVVVGRAASVWLDGNVQSTSYLDPASLGRVPTRVLLGTGARVEVMPHLGVSLAVANVTDQRISYLPLDPAPSPAMTETPTALTDVAGFPLPGRSFYLALDWTH